MTPLTRILFIDRDGTLINEPLPDRQIDSLEKLDFMPGVFRYLGNIANELPYKLVIVSNQDGLGTDSFPESTFVAPQQKMMDAFAREGIMFEEALFDRSLPAEKKATRKPGTGLLKKYMSGGFDLAGSYVIGDRVTDVMLAKNLGAKGILYAPSSSREELEAEMLKQNCADSCALFTDEWKAIYEFLRQRKATRKRATSETDVYIELNLDGKGESQIETGLGFYDHMLAQISRHSGCDLIIRAKGDLHVDEHHLIEDVGIALGEAFASALGDKIGIERYGFSLPMDDCKAEVLLDFGGRTYFIWKAKFKRERVGDVPTEMFPHFFRSFAEAAKINLHIRARGGNEHHKIESIFKAFAKALKAAIRRDPNAHYLPSSKGTL